jgi:hypothetical protein
MYVASAFWPDRPEDYAVGAHFVTNKFTNLSARTVANFDFSDPDNHDYRPGNHSLLIWGRPSWLGSQGFQSLMFLAVQPLAGLLTEQGAINWAPKYFAGYDPNGAVVWADTEAQALPVYGAEDYATSPEHDYVVHFSVTWVESLARWVMVYGGSVPAWLAADRATLEVPAITHPQPSPGSLYARTSRHPWGRATRDAAVTEAWSAPALFLNRAAVSAYLACDEDPERKLPCGVSPNSNRPSALVNLVGMRASPVTPAEAAEIGAMCLAGSTALETQYTLADDSGGHLYGVNIIESWTQDVSATLSDLAPGTRAVELYYNISTWNPYAVLLMKGQLQLAAP